MDLNLLKKLRLVSQNVKKDDKELANTFLTAMERVALICLKYPKARDNYNLLHYIYWKNYQGLTIEYKQIEQLTTATTTETIGRAFRKLVEETKGTEWESKFSPAERVKKRRKLREQNIEKFIAKPTFEW